MRRAVLILSVLALLVTIARASQPAGMVDHGAPSPAGSLGVGVLSTALGPPDRSQETPPRPLTLAQLLARTEWLIAHARGVIASPLPPIPRPSPLPSAHPHPINWYAIAACESGGRWSLNDRNGYWGGLQFQPSTWFSAGGGAFNGSGPFPYSAAYQIAVANRWVSMVGCYWCRAGWPSCGRFG